MKDIVWHEARETPDVGEGCCADALVLVDDEMTPMICQYAHFPKKNGKHEVPPGFRATSLSSQDYEIGAGGLDVRRWALIGYPRD